MAGPSCLISAITNNCLTIQSDGGLHVPCPTAGELVDNGDGTITFTPGGGTPVTINICDIVNTCGFYSNTIDTNVLVANGATVLLSASVTIPSDGVYLVREGISLVGDTGSYFELELLINGVGTGRQVATELPVNGYSGGDTIPLQLSAADVLTYRIRSVSGPLTVESAGLTVIRGLGV